MDEQNLSEGDLELLRQNESDSRKNNITDENTRKMEENIEGYLDYSSANILKSKEFGTIFGIAQNGSQTDLDNYFKVRDDTTRQANVDNDYILKEKISNIQKLQNDISNLNVNLAELTNSEKIIAQIDKLKNEVISKLPKSERKNKEKTIKLFISDYAKDDEMETRRHAKKITTPGGYGFVAKTLNSYKTKNASKALNNLSKFMDDNKIKEKMDSDPLIKRSIEQISSLESDQNPLEVFQDQISSIQKTKAEFEKNLVRYNKELSERNEYITNEHSKKIQSERDNINTFINDVQEFSKKPAPDPSQIIKNLDSLNEPATFNFSIQTNDIEGMKNVFKMAGVDLEMDPNKATDTSKWYARRQGGEGSDESFIDVHTPFFSPEDIKNKLPKVLATIDQFGMADLTIDSVAARRNIAIGATQSSILLEQPDKELAVNNAKQVLGVTANGDVDYSSIINEVMTKGSYAHEADSNLVQKYSNANEIKYLFNGTMISDDNFSLSCRAGRNGTQYAGPNLEYASGYTGALEHTKGSNTGDKYITCELTHNKEAISSQVTRQLDEYRLGFINVYAADSSNTYYCNFGCEDSNLYENQKLLSPEKALTDRSAETLISPKNQPIAKLAVINDKIYEIPKDDPRWQAVLDVRKADIKDTFKDGKEDIFARNRAQYNEMKATGKVKTHAITFDGIKFGFNKQVNSDEKIAKQIMTQRGLRGNKPKTNKDIANQQVKTSNQTQLRDKFESER